MATLFELHDFKNGYKDVVDAIIKNGEPVSPRGQKTRELRNVTITVDDASNCAPLGVGRNLPTKIIAAETMQLLSGVSDLKQLDEASKGNFSQFSDDGEILSGAYGPRIFYQLRRVIDSLSMDRDSRQAGVTIRHGNEIKNPSKDVPCTVNKFFSIRSDKLHMSTYMRSNDVWLGSAIDFPVFCQVQAAVAKSLDIEIGQYTHTAVSLHLYERNLDAASNLVYVDDSEAEKIPFFADSANVSPMNSPRERWEEITDLALAVKIGMIDSDNYGEGVSWFDNQLTGLDQHSYFCEDRYFRSSSPA